MTMSKRCLVPLALTCLLAGSAGGEPARDLDLVFLLDTTGSMSGEIREAKERVQQVAEALRSSRPGARVRLGVVAFRDRGDDYLTKVQPLTSDVDAVDAFLSALRAGGGGDGPEDLLSGLAAALGELDWNESLRADRQLFLIGDAPPHLDYEDGRTTDSIIEEARERRIVLNTIGCRSLSKSGVQFFRTLAYATEGAYHHVGRVELGGTRRTSTPGLADAVVATLARDPEREGTRRRLDLKPSDATPPESNGALSVERLLFEDDGRCLIGVTLPPGLGLSADPRAQVADDALEIALALESGQGGSQAFALAPCPSASLPIRVMLED
jgi:uncharacterized protein YegL